MTTPITALTPSFAAIRDDAEFTWAQHARLHGFAHAVITAWEPVATAPDGQLILSGRVDGPCPVEQLRSFADKNMLVQGYAGDLRPFMDLAEPGRVAVVWRTGGVWVSLWTPEPPPPPTAPSPDPVDVPQPGGRLLHWLNPDTSKEN
ncbi:hypothetical protein SSOG_09147 [Streptomyces himastatinicus ATCC 53653]|uniref:Uncharacterized protein n=1 Tax=Streptomyces himastatinicus ATCC 53653 TaxID=457427 RepID=D9WX04_9ACTN|nr:hypothetical protein [Streptomyces himastatinicus]EFL29433.1 hypothetical protein SSOG_09147 [Streptomyces himastatinicus ATCC 53653]